MAALSSATSVQSSVQSRCFNRLCPNLEQLNKRVSFCGRCLFATYCNEGCQIADLQRHKEECAEKVLIFISTSVKEIVAEQAMNIAEYKLKSQENMPSIMTSSSRYSWSKASREKLKKMHDHLQTQASEKRQINRENRAKIEKEIAEMQALLDKLAFVKKVPITKEAAEMLESEIRKFIKEDLQALSLADTSCSLISQFQSNLHGKLANSSS